MRDWLQAASFAILAASAAGAQTNFGSVNLGQKSTATVTLTVPAPATAGSVSVVTQGAAGLDFIDARTGTCAAGTSYVAGQTCTVDVVFKPAYPGTRYGQAALKDSTGRTIASASLVGVGTAALATFNPAPAIGILAPVDGVSLNNPFGVAVDGTGNLYIADNRNARVVEVPFGGGQPLAIEPVVNGKGLVDPGGVAIDGAGNLYISDLDGDVVVEVPADGTAPVTINPMVSGTGLKYPCGMVIDSAGNLFIADVDNARVLKIPADGSAPAVVNAAVDGAALIYPVAVALDTAGDLYIADLFANRVVQVPAGGGPPVAINPTVNGQGLTLPYGIAVDAAGDLLIADALNRIVEVPANGSAAFATEPTANGAGLNDPIGIALDGAGNLFIADSLNNRVVEVERGHGPALNFAATAPGAISADSPKTAWIENSGNTPLSFPVPATGNNPTITAGFSLASGGAGDCNVESAGAGTAATLAPGAECDFRISFQPAAQGSAGGTLTMVDNSMNAGAPGYATQTIALSGNAPVVTLSAPRVDFAPQVVGTDSSLQHLTVTNEGSGTLTIASTTVTGAGAADFNLTNGCGSTLAPGAACTMDLQFAASDPGAATAAITITDNANGSPHSVLLSGDAVIQTSMTIAPTNQSITAAQASAVTVTVAGKNGSPTPTGSVALTSGIYASGPVLLSQGMATIKIPAGSLPVGTDSLKATYTPDMASATTYAGTSATASVTVAAVATVTAPAASTGGASSITYSSASVAGTANPNGADTHVWFLYGETNSLANASQTASQDIGAGSTPVQISAPLTGLDDSSTIYFRVVAQNSAGTTMGLIGSFQTPAEPYFSLEAGSPVTVKAGAVSGNTSTVTLTPWYSFTGTVNLSCTITPAAANDPPLCTVPASVALTGSSAQTATITVTTTAPGTSNAGGAAGFSWPWAAGGAALACVFWRRRRSSLRLVLMAAIMLAFSAGCGGGGTTPPIQKGPPPNPGTSTGTYTIIVTATNGSTTETASTSLTVQ